MNEIEKAIDDMMELELKCTRQEATISRLESENKALHTANDLTMNENLRLRAALQWYASRTIYERKSMVPRDDEYIEAQDIAIKALQPETEDSAHGVFGE